MDTATLVEPEKQRKKLIPGLLEEEGLPVESFDTAEQAVGQARKVVPDLVIMEVKLPSRSGSLVLAELKNSNVPVILLTTRHVASELDDLYALGDAVRVPLGKGELRSHIRGILERRPRRESCFVNRSGVTDK